MRHKLVYDALIAKARARGSIAGYSERHHIIPKSLGGSNALDNLVNLTAREHFIAHMLLAHMHGGKMWLAVVKMAKQCDKKNSKGYEIARRNSVTYLKNRKITWGKKISIAHTGKVRGPLTTDRRKKISIATIGRVCTDETKQKISNALIGKTHNPNTKLKMQLARQAYWANKKAIEHGIR
jgi:hypothetical protein